MGLFYYSFTILAFYKMPKHGAQQQSPDQTVRNIINWFLTQYIAQMIAGTLSSAEFLKHLAESLDTIVRFHVDKIYKPDFVQLITLLLDAFSQLTDADFLHSVVKLLNEKLGPKGFVFSLSDADGTWRMTGAVAGEQSVAQIFASAVYGGGIAASVVSEPHVARSFASAVGGGGSVASAASSTACMIRMNPFHVFFGIRENEVPGFLQNLVNSITLAPSIRIWLLASSFFKDIFLTFSGECLSVLGIVPRAGSFCSPFTKFYSAMFEGDSGFRNVVRDMLSKTQRNIVVASEHFAVILRIIYQVLDQTGQPILSEESFTMILNRLREVQRMFDDKLRLQFRSQVVASLLGFFLIQILDSADHKKRMRDVLQFKTLEAIEKACAGDLDRNFANSINPHFFECRETGCNINPRTLLVANTHREAATRAKALGELQKFYETIAKRKQEKKDGLEKESKLRSSMSKLAVGGGCAAEAQSDDCCCVCMDGEKNHTFVPCGHLCVCATCAAQCQTCPICREHVIGSLKIFGC
jgi:hypothetical protein